MKLILMWIERALDLGPAMELKMDLFVRWRLKYIGEYIKKRNTEQPLSDCFYCYTQMETRNTRNGPCKFFQSLTSLKFTFASNQIKHQQMISLRILGNEIDRIIVDKILYGAEKLLKKESDDKVKNQKLFKDQLA